MMCWFCKLRMKLKKKINEFYKPYIFQRKYKQPYVVGKIACSKDFFIKSLKSKYISNTYAQSFSHHLRYKNQAILVTYKTINEDNPLLDCRLSGLNEFSPVKVIIDKDLKVKKKANIFKVLFLNLALHLGDQCNINTISFFGLI